MRTIRVKVNPNARVRALAEAGGGWVASVKAPPVDGRANTELVALVAEHFGVPKAAVTIRSGAGSRLKLVQIDD